MRIKNTIKNSLFSLGSYLYLFLVGIFIRKLFLENFSLEYLGYEGLFGSIFLLLSIAELGASGMFGYMLYAAIAKDDREEISVIMGMYRKLYFCIGTFVFVLGGILFFFLPYIIVDEVKNWNYVRVIYLIQLFTTLVTYFLAYRRALFIAVQKSYEIVKIETAFKTINSLVRVAVILLLKNYIIYLLVPFVTNILTNIVIWEKSRKQYPDIYKYKATWKDFKDRNAFLQLRSLLLSKISTIIYTSSDNIILARITGIANVGYYSNYSQIYNFGVQVIWNAIGPLNESTGNMVNSESKEKNRRFFDAFDMFGYFLGMVGLCVIVCCFQKLIVFLYGEQYLISIFAVLALGENFYIGEKAAAYNAFQNAVGHYETNRIYSVMSAVTNVVFSIVFGLKWGLAGVLMATVLGNILIQAGRAHIVYKWIFTEERILRVILKEIVFIFTANISLAITVLLTQNIKSNLMGLFISVTIAIIVPVLLGIALFYRTKMFVAMMDYIENSLKTIVLNVNRRKLEK